ncbi:hypothetical protein [Streptomyces sp. CAU 1734]|uniref:hypothetical protein n=1 Tax=Streptomyces sp. CAU 1734 TaxID=3140360 RepID=UPI0032616EAA
MADTVIDRPGYEEVHRGLLAAAARLETLRRPAGAPGVEPHATAAGHAVAFAAVMLRRLLSGAAAAPPPGESERLLVLAAKWREAALGIGDFAPAPEPRPSDPRAAKPPAAKPRAPAPQSSAPRPPEPRALRAGGDGPVRTAVPEPRLPPGSGAD